MSNKSKHVLVFFLGIGLMALIILMRPDQESIPGWVTVSTLAVLGLGTVLSFLIATGFLKGYDNSDQTMISDMVYKKLFYRNAAYAAALSLVVLAFKYLDNGLSGMTGADFLLMLLLVIVGVFLYTLAQVWISSRQKIR